MTAGHVILPCLSPASLAITSMGAKLRRYKLDELPELCYVLICNMSIEGPRPDVPGYTDALVGEDREVLLLRPFERSIICLCSLFASLHGPLI